MWASKGEASAGRWGVVDGVSWKRGEDNCRSWNVIDEGKNGCRWNLMRKEAWSMRPNNGRCVTDGNSGGMFPGRSVWVMGQ